MREAATVLDVLRERGRRGLPLERLYRQLFNPQLYLLAYGRLYSNKGAMTPGPDGETVDGMSLAKIGRVIDALRHERYRFKPVRRTYIPKKNGKKRPLGLPSWSDKLVGEVVRLLLEAYYEPQFSDRSHGYRPERGCHTALSEVANRWPGTTWFIEGDVSDCFGSLDHDIMLSIAGGQHPRRPVPSVAAQHAPSRIPGGLGMARHAVRRSARRCGLPDPLQYLSGQVGQFVENSSHPGIHPRRPAGHPTLTTKKWKSNSCVRADAATAPAVRRCASSGAACPARTPRSGLPAAALRAVLPTTTSSGSPDRRPKPRRSRPALRRSCVTNSSWNCRRTRP